MGQHRTADAKRWVNLLPDTTGNLKCTNDCFGWLEKYPFKVIFESVEKFPFLVISKISFYGKIENLGKMKFE